MFRLPARLSGAFGGYLDDDDNARLDLLFLGTGGGSIGGFDALATLLAMRARRGWGSLLAAPSRTALFL